MVNPERKSNDIINKNCYLFIRIPDIISVHEKIIGLVYDKAEKSHTNDDALGSLHKHRE